MTPAARKELDRLEDAPPSRMREVITLRGDNANLRAKLAEALAQIHRLQTDIELLTFELARARRACEAAGVEVL